jgi:hypothetical protein
MSTASPAIDQRGSLPAQVAPLTVTESIAVTEISPRMAALCTATPGSWTEDDLAYYVGEELGRIHGPQLPCSGRDRILHEFWERFGIDAVRIARAAFEVHKGMWMGAPVTVRRFAAGHDEFFSAPILRELA